MKHFSVHDSNFPDNAAAEYAQGARGFVIRRLQTALDLKPDGIFGGKTASRLREFQRERDFPITGRAGETVFVSAGAAWPSEFERCMNMVSNFEGTGFGDCNLRDIDDAGLTMGIAGFTTQHGEVGELLARFIAERPDALDCLSPLRRDNLVELLSRRASPRQWKFLFYNGNRTVHKEWRQAFTQWGHCAIMQRLQLEMAEEKFWRRALADADSLGFNSIRARCFFLDVAVQNGGWRKAHLVTARRMADWLSGDEQQALTVAARAVAACARLPWRNDVLSRKMAIATGRGVVHGRRWDLAANAIP